MGHMACTLHGVIDPAFLPDIDRRHRARAWSRPSPSGARGRSKQVIDEYETYSEQAADVFARVQDRAAVETMLPMGELGTHPMSILPSTFLFDGYTHLRNDILTPNGSIDRPRAAARREAPAPDDRVDARGPAVDVRRRARRSSTARSRSTLDGPGGGTWTIAPGGDDGRVLVTEGAAPDVGRDGHAAPITTS